MGTTNKIKKPYPFASLLIIFSAIIAIVAQVITILQDFYSFTNLGTPDALFFIPALFGIITTIIATVRYILLAVFARNTTRKPGIPYIIVSVLITVGAFLGIPLVLASSAIPLLYANAITTITSTISTAFSIVTQVLFAIMYLTMLIYTIRIKKSNKPSNIANIWYIFCIPGCLCIVSMVISRFFKFLVVTEQYPFDSVIATFSALNMVAHSLKILLIVAALFCVAYQFAKVNKNLPVEEATEITQ